MIKIEHLSKRYGQITVLKGISLDLEAGGVYGIVGANGAGKTTLFRCIAGLEDYSGLIDSSIPRLKDKMGLLFTEPFFFSKMTGKEYIQLLANARSVVLKDIESNNIFDLPLHQYASDYSTGMKKKLALTAVLLQGNEVFILDEPFNGVDIQSNLIIIELIKKLRSMDKTILISSHIFSTLSEICDEIICLEDGRITKRVCPEEFADLEEEMRMFTIGDKLSKLVLS